MPCTKLQVFCPVQPDVWIPWPPIQTPTIPYQQLPETRSDWLHVSPPKPTELRPKLILVDVRIDTLLMSETNPGRELVNVRIGSHLPMAKNPQILTSPLQTFAEPEFVFTQRGTIAGGTIWTNVPLYCLPSTIGFITVGLLFEVIDELVIQAVTPSMHGGLTDCPA